MREEMPAFSSYQNKEAIKKYLCQNVLGIPETFFFAQYRQILQPICHIVSKYSIGTKSAI